MAKKKASQSVKDIDQYTHADKTRANNPQVGLVTPETDKDGGKQTYQYDPHLDPQLQWAGKAEHTSFEVPTVSLHVHERIDPRSIIETVRRKHETETDYQPSLFFGVESNLPLFQEIEFYKHKHNWANRLIAGDSTLVMNSLLVKEGMAGSVQMVYFDPPYGIKYGSNFQPFVNKRDVKDGKDDDLTSEPETLRAFRDTWELGIHSYLTYLRDRLLLARELLHESGSIFVQISDENVHLVRNIMDEVFEPENFVAIITFKTATNQNAKRIQRLYDHLIWYAKDNSKLKFKSIYRNRTQEEIENIFNNFDEKTAKRYKAAQIDDYDETQVENLRKVGRLTDNGKYGKRFEDDFVMTEIDNVWQGTIISTFSKEKKFVVQTSKVTIERCMTMTTDCGDLVLDITCGSGTTAFVAEQWGRRWITCDTSRVALTLAKQRLMTATFDYFELANPSEGVSSGFKYETVPHITLKSIANNEPPATETLYDKPFKDNKRARVTSPFTVEAVPAPVVQALHEASETETAPADNSIARSGESLRQDEWRSELLRTGIRGRRGEKMLFSRVEPLGGTRFLHADAEVMNENGTETSRAVVSFAPEFNPLSKVQVEMAFEEARYLRPVPKFVIFAGFSLDPAANELIDKLNFPGITLLKAQMNADLQTADLKKNRSSNESFWLIGQPDVQLKEVGKNDKKEKLYTVEVLGFDYYNVRDGAIESGGANRIAVWMLDTNFDGRSLFPHQVFFPLSGAKEGWTKLAKNLNAEIDQELIESYHGSISLPFTFGDYKRIAVKIVDDRGIESLKLIDVA